ncbi:hypothetical protein C0992_010261 [Termitomyces sp. T32_za158]|nr:hypothetical protein C0992_010261 [Termitomyces sp. T32_za158]
MTTNTVENDALKASVFQRLHPRVYLERFLAENFRPDGRVPDAWRDVNLNVGVCVRGDLQPTEERMGSISTADGSALVRLGNTTVVCGVKAEIAEPELDREGEGFLVPNLDLPAMCSPKFKPGPPTEEAQVVSDRLNEVLVASGILPLDSLCIHHGKSVWVLYVDATCINYDGNVFDATLLAMVAALKNSQFLHRVDSVSCLYSLSNAAQLPKATYDEETGRTICTRKTKSPLQIKRTPIAMSFGVFNSFVPWLFYNEPRVTFYAFSTTILADPTSFEEPLLDTTVSVVLDAHSGDLISAIQLGIDTTPSQNLLQTCMTAAVKRRPALAERV